MEERSLGLLIVGLGGAAIVVGLIVMSGGLSWFGRLPGDVRIERENMRVFIPFSSMILVSLALTLIMNVARRFL